MRNGGRKCTASGDVREVSVLAQSDGPSACGTPACGPTNGEGRRVRRRTLGAALVAAAAIAAALVRSAWMHDHVWTSLWHGLASGQLGAVAGLVQVLSLMWLRTVMNYQYAHGTGFAETIRIMWREGGVRRFYQGVSLALIHAPLIRAGDVAANEGVDHLFTSAWAHVWLSPMRALIISSLATSWRLLLQPLDALKTNMQIHGHSARAVLTARARAEGPLFLFDGSCASMLSTFIGQLPYWATFKACCARTGPSALSVGLCAWAATCVSNLGSNVFHVLKTARQASGARSYADAVRAIVRKDGVRGLFARGLFTRMLANSMQSVVFTVVWRLLATKGQRRHA